MATQNKLWLRKHPHMRSQITTEIMIVSNTLWTLDEMKKSFKADIGDIVNNWDSNSFQTEFFIEVQGRYANLTSNNFKLLQQGSATRDNWTVYYTSNPILTDTSSNNTNNNTNTNNNNSNSNSNSNINNNSNSNGNTTCFVLCINIIFISPLCIMCAHVGSIRLYLCIV